MSNGNFYVYFLLFTIFTISLVSYPTRASEPLSAKTIVIDVGHGGVDPGVVVGKVYEKDINLKISKNLEKKLKEKGAKVLMTRDGDYDLGVPKATYRKKSDFDNRIKLINNSKADYYISIHLNFLGDGSYYGPQVFYNKKDEYNEKMAKVFQETLNSYLNTKREIKKIPQSTYMYSKLNVRGILVECGFLSNAHERSLLLSDEYLERFADYLTEAFLKI